MVWEDTDSEKVVNNCETKIQRPQRACLGNCRKEVGVYRAMVKPEIVSGSNECMGHHSGGWVAMLFLGSVTTSCGLASLVFSKRDFQESPLLPSCGWSSFPWIQEHNTVLSVQGELWICSSKSCWTRKEPSVLHNENHWAELGITADNWRTGN